MKPLFVFSWVQKTKTIADGIEGLLNGLPDYLERPGRKPKVAQSSAYNGTTRGNPKNRLYLQIIESPNIIAPIVDA